MKKALELEPQFPLVREWLADVYWVAGSKEEAIAIADDVDSNLGRVYRLAFQGRKQEARAAISSLPPDLMVDEGEIVLHLLWNDTDTFFERLGEVAQKQRPQIITVLDSPLQYSLRSDPRMKVIRERLGLPP